MRRCMLRLSEKVGEAEKLPRENFVEMVVRFIDLYLASESYGVYSPKDFRIVLPSGMHFRIRHSFDYQSPDSGLFQDISAKCKEAGWHCYITDDGLGVNRIM